MQCSNIAQPRASQSKIQGTYSSTKTADETKKKNDKTKKGDKKMIEFQLPPLSIAGKKKELDFEQIRKKVIRRCNPEGEDKKQLASILKHLRDSKAKITVHEYVNLIAKYTTDKGEAMRRVLEEDLASFRKMVNKIYENMTQDVSDVLVNEQIQTTNFYQERYDIFNSKMLWMISEVFQMIPEFNMEKYVNEKQAFLDYVCPIPALDNLDSEDLSLLKRQEAFHRLQWLKIEEDRLAEENRRLEQRWEDLKNQHKKETTQSSMKSVIMEKRMYDLEVEEQEKQVHLNELEHILGKNIVRTEAYVRLEEDEAIRLTKPILLQEKKSKTRKSAKSENWSAITAANMEEKAAKKLLDAGRARADEKKRMRRREREPGKETTLFAEPPPKEYPEFSSVNRIYEKNIQQTTTTVQEKRPPRPRKGTCGAGCG